MSIRSTLIFLTLGIATATLAPRAGMAQDYRMRQGTRQWSMWAGGSWTDRLGPSYSSIPTQPYAMLAVRSEYVLEVGGPFALSYFMEALPIIAVGNVPRYHTAIVWVPPEGPMREEKVWDAPATVFGAGLSPIGFQGYAFLSRSVSLFVSSSAGLAWFTRDMPVPDSRQLNFTADAGAGFRYVRGGQAFLTGIKFHHMSNAYTGRQNPGLDGNVVYAGLSHAR